LRRFEYYAPTSVDEAAQLLAERTDGSRPLAGGTDLIIQMKERGRRVPSIISLRRVGDLRGVSVTSNGSLRIGAMATATDVASNPLVQRGWPSVVDGADLVGSVQIRNRATIGGNVCNAAPSADAVPSLIALGATALVTGPRGNREVLLEHFFVGPGQTVLTPGEVVVEIVVPPQSAGGGGAYVRHVPRREMDIAVVGVGIQIQLDGDGQSISDARVVLASVAPTPIRSPQAEAALRGNRLTDDVIRAAGEGAAADARPITDVRGSADYRRDLLRVYTGRVAQIAHQRARGIRSEQNGH
jgi:CO/xanthine dehydrogenase FAD-binding subunit